ncbi:hypothetical protein C7459_11379 [Tumebacillus permanentifrigoris]|uniref:Uncharacterized protein n=1 Tax=Tumebacillus permanentifrigoris TaxID=378543 RepID=A0A316D774_9BACL|nr:hypothetical protein C7459_11379 [Tumebacillus permanentifrigoris]
MASPTQVARSLLEVVGYLLMLLLVLIFFTGQGTFIYEGF